MEDDQDMFSKEIENLFYYSQSDDFTATGADGVFHLRERLYDQFYSSQKMESLLIDEYQRLSVHVPFILSY